MTEFYSNSSHSLSDDTIADLAPSFVMDPHDSINEVFKKVAEEELCLSKSMNNLFKKVEMNPSDKTVAALLNYSKKW